LPANRFDGHGVERRKEIIHPTGNGIPSEDVQDALWQILDMLEHSDALIGVYDANDFLRFTNLVFRQAYFIEPGERLDWQSMMRRNHAAGRGTNIRGDNIDTWIASVRSRRGKARLRTYESNLHDGRFIWVVETALENGWIIVVGTDVTELNASERMLRMARDMALRDASTDELTGVSNRRHIIGKLEEMIAERRGTRGAACLVDLDHFKKINDTFGHQAGDDALIAFARCARQTIRLRDGFGRFGGEEFLFLFPGQTAEEARPTIERVFDAVRALRPFPSQPDRGITFSAGLSMLVDGDGVSSLLSRCDAALYAAKEAGRDRLCMNMG
jgi:diguanylate cyclase (GGDEF)-like protein